MLTDAQVQAHADRIRDDDNHDPIELLGRERGKRMVWEATDARKARMAEAAKG